MGVQMQLWLLVLATVSLQQIAQAKQCPAFDLDPGRSRKKVERADIGVDEDSARPNNNSMCTMWGNFHIKTFDGDVFHFQQNCNYLFSSNCKSFKEDFNIQVQRTSIDSLPAIVKITINMNGVVFIIRKDSVLMDDNLLTLPFLSSWMEIKLYGNYLKVAAATTGFIMAWNQADRLHLELDPKYMNQTCGLCGDFNGIPIYNEFILNGIQLSPYEYGSLQKADGPDDACTEDPYILDDPCFDTNYVCEMMFYSLAFADCYKIVGTLPYIQTCTEDRCRCNTSENLNSFCFCSTVAEYARECAEGGGTPLDWRTPQVCPRSCPPGMEYKECGPWNVDTCSSHGMSPFQMDICVDNCFCLDGTVLDDITDRGCIPVDKCACVFNGEVYPSGATYANPCRICECKGGHWNCASKACPGFCHIEGGSHITTYDEVTYTFHGECDYVLSKMCSDNSFIVNGQLLKCGLTNTETCLTRVTVLIDKVTLIEIDASGNTFVSFTNRQLPFIGVDFVIFKPCSVFIIVDLSLGVQLQIQLVPIMQLYIRVEPDFQGKLCGLCGNFNNKQLDEFTDSMGMPTGTPAAFGNSWKVYSTCPDVKNNFEDPCTIHSENEKYAQTWCSLLLDPNEQFALCHHVLNPTSYFKKCLYDTCGCRNNEDCLCAAISSYVRGCAMRGVILTGWRVHVCSKYAANCSATMVYNYNVSSCQPTCPSLHKPDAICNVNFVPVDGCVCPDGEYLDNSNSCVIASHCPCDYQGTLVPYGGTISGIDIKCTCSEGHMDCVHVDGCIPPHIYFNCTNKPPGTSGTECQRSCQTISVPCVSRQCISGCMCPNDMVLDGSSGCVPDNQCPCVQNGVKYNDGDTVQVNCNTCTCVNHAWNCTNVICLGTCTTYGEGNFVTFDNLRYRFSGNCDYIMAQDFCSSATDQGTFSIVIKDVLCSTSNMTCAKSLILILGTYKFTFSNGQFAVVDTKVGVHVTYKIRYMGIYLVVEGSNGMVLMWNKKITIFVKLTAEFMGSVCGLCGNYDDNSMNDFTTRNRALVTDVAVFANSWKFSPDCHDVEPPTDPCLHVPSRKYWAQLHCSIILSRVFAHCHQQVDPVPFYETCVSDACACDTGEECECFCTAVAYYAYVCSEHHVCVSWRTPDICPMFCDYYNDDELCAWHYRPCGAPCLKTCRNLIGQCFYILPGLEGCYPKCPPEKPYFDEDKKKCVATCGCYDDEDNPYEIGQVVDLCKPCLTCNCTEDGIMCLYDVEACFCLYNGLVYKYGALIYTTTDNEGLCVNVTCGANGTMDHRSYLCQTTTTSTTTGCMVEICEWSPWYDVSYPEFGPDGGDFETFANIRDHGYPICDVPQEVHCRAERFPDKTLQDLGQNLVCSETAGLVCYNTDQDGGLCYNYQIEILCCSYVDRCTSTPTTTPTSVCVHEVCSWSPWFDTSVPDQGPDGGEFETFDNIRSNGYDICSTPEDIKCRAELLPNVPIDQLFQTVQCNKMFGLTCYNNQQSFVPVCYNYQIQVLCCYYVPCDVSSTTLTSTTNCMCYYDGKPYSPGDVVYAQTDSKGCVFYGVCSTQCQIEQVQGPCFTTSSSTLRTTTRRTTTTTTTKTTRTQTSTRFTTRSTTTSRKTTSVPITSTPSTSKAPTTTTTRTTTTPRRTTTVRQTSTSLTTSSTTRTTVSTTTSRRTTSVPLTSTHSTRTSPRTTTRHTTTTPRRTTTVRQTSTSLTTSSTRTTVSTTTSRRTTSVPITSTHSSRTTPRTTTRRTSTTPRRTTTVRQTSTSLTTSSTTRTTVPTTTSRRTTSVPITSTHSTRTSPRTTTRHTTTTPRKTTTVRQTSSSLTTSSTTRTTVSTTTSRRTTSVPITSTHSTRTSPRTTTTHTTTTPRRTTTVRQTSTSLTTSSTTRTTMSTTTSRKTTSVPITSTHSTRTSPRTTTTRTTTTPRRTTTVRQTSTSLTTSSTTRTTMSTTTSRKTTSVPITSTSTSKAPTTTTRRTTTTLRRTTEVRQTSTRLTTSSTTRTTVSTTTSRKTTSVPITSTPSTSKAPTTTTRRTTTTPRRTTEVRQTSTRLTTSSTTRTTVSTTTSRKTTSVPITSTPSTSKAPTTTTRRTTTTPRRTTEVRQTSTRLSTSSTTRTTMSTTTSRKTTSVPITSTPSTSKAPTTTTRRTTTTPRRTTEVRQTSTRLTTSSTTRTTVSTTTSRKTTSVPITSTPSTSKAPTTTTRRTTTTPRRTTTVRQTSTTLSSTRSSTKSERASSSTTKQYQDFTVTSPYIVVLNCSNATCEMDGSISIMTIFCPALVFIQCQNGNEPIRVYDDDHCCYHYECPVCVGPDGSSKLIGDKWQSNCNNCECNKMAVVECSPVNCGPSPDPVNCNRVGFESIIVQQDCCYIYQCRCNTNLCPLPLTCDIGFQLTASFEPNDCCTTYDCVPKDICVVDGIEYPPLSTIPSAESLCIHCECSADKDPDTHLNKVVCAAIDCINVCPPGYTMVHSDGECCGTCVQEACVMNNPDGTQGVYQPGEIIRPPDQNCITYRCDNTDNTFTLVVEKTNCPPFQPDICRPGTIQMTPDGCCETCEVDTTKTCALQSMLVPASLNSCSGTIEISYCSGPCMGSARYMLETQTMARDCSCCMELEMTTVETTLDCPGGNTISYSYNTVTKCDCVHAACVI